MVTGNLTEWSGKQKKEDTSICTFEVTYKIILYGEQRCQDSRDRRIHCESKYLDITVFYHQFSSIKKTKWGLGCSQVGKVLA